MANIKKIKIGETTYDIRDASVPGQISTAIGNLDSSATVASESSGTITITKTITETNGKIGADTETTTTNTVAKIDEKDAQQVKSYFTGEAPGPGNMVQAYVTLGQNAYSFSESAWNQVERSLIFDREDPLEDTPTDC